MRRKSERNPSNKKAKASPEKKVEKVKRTRTRRRKQSSSSENESVEETKKTQSKAVVLEEPVKVITQSPAKEVANAEGPDQVWQVKTSEGSGDTGEIQKLKICLTRPPSTPERIDRSPRSKRKHSRATSSSDTASIEIVEDKKKGKHRSKRATRESRDEPEPNYDSQGNDIEPESEVKEQPIMQSDSTVTQSSDSQLQGGSNDTPNEAPMSTTNEEEKVEIVIEIKETEEIILPSEIVVAEVDIQNKPSDADTTVLSPKPDTLHCSVVEEVRVKDDEIENKSLPEEKSEVLEIHAEENKTSEVDIAEPQQDDQEEEPTREFQGKEETTPGNEVSKKEDKTETAISEPTEAQEPEVFKGDVENNVVVNSGNDTSSGRKLSTDDKVEESSKENHKKELEKFKSIQSTQEENMQVIQSAPLTINRKRRWGSRPSKIMSQTSITISTDVLKDIISDVKPVEFEEVIEEKKHHKRIEVTEKIERPVLPKIIIDNTENVEQHKKESEESKDRDNIKSKESQLGSNRKISIVKENDSIVARPPSPPRHKQSCILFITNLVRPFTLPQLKNLLQRTGKIVEDGFWIDKIKSKCYVKYENEDQAFETRHALHGVTWPVSNPKSLQVDFSNQEAFDKAKANEDTDNAQATTLPGTVEDWLREQDMKRERGELEKPWERKAAVREWDVGKDGKEKDTKDKIRRDERMVDKRRHKTPERSPEPAKKFKKEEEAPAKLLDNLFRKTKTTPCIYWLPLSAETIAIKEEQRRQHMAEHERRMQELRRAHRPRH